MNGPTILYLLRVFDHYGLKPREVTIKGKKARSISFTEERNAYSVVALLCEENGWTFHTSADEFIGARSSRYQVHIGKPLTESR